MTTLFALAALLALLAIMLYLADGGELMGMIIARWGNGTNYVPAMGD